MLIHKSHSKKDIIKLFQKHGVKIDDTQTKGNIVSNIEQYMINFQYDKNIENLTMLKDYLKGKSTKQRPTAQQKNNIMFSAKRIIKWVKSSYVFQEETYNNKEEAYNDIMSIYMWGDLPSVRRACKFYNESPYCMNHINPIMTDEVKQEILQNKIIKSQIIYKLKIRRAKDGNPIVVRFD